MKLKKIFILFLFIAGGYILFTSIGSITTFFGKDQTTAKVTNKIDVIEFDISSASLTIIPEKRADLKAELDGRGKLTVDQSGDTITVTHERKWFEWVPFFNSSKLTVFVPEDYHQDMVMNTGSGNIHLSGKSSKEPFKLKELQVDMGSGNVKLNHLSVDEFVHDGSSGNLSINSLTSNKSTIDISSGNVKMTEFVGKLNADLSSGRLEVQMSELKDSIQIDVSSGNVSLDLPDNADFTLDGDIGSGNISYDFPLTVEKQDNHDIKGSHGSGKHEIEIDVSSGNVKIY